MEAGLAEFNEASEADDMLDDDLGVCDVMDADNEAGPRRWSPILLPSNARDMRLVDTDASDAARTDRRALVCIRSRLMAGYYRFAG